MRWTRVHPSVWLWRDSCNVYAVEGPDGMLIVNAGTGRWLDELKALPKRPVALACTHYFRDHSAGAARAAKEGIPVLAPEYERHLFTDPALHFQRRETYIIYGNIWDHFAPVEPIPVAASLRDYDRISLAGIPCEVLPLPGATPTQCGLAFSLPENRETLVFCGEAIHSPGRLARIAPLQYNYNDLNGAAGAFYSAATLLARGETALFPSLGEPLLQGSGKALSTLAANLRTLAKLRPGLEQAMNGIGAEELEEITPHVWRNPNTWAFIYFLISRSGKALAIDYGYPYHFAMSGFPYHARPEHRRAFLHSFPALKQRFGIERIDTVLVSHFHDDHVCGIPLLQRLHGTQCWAAENFAEILENPFASAFPCTWPQPIEVQRKLPLGEEFSWEEYTFRLRPMTGHTRFSSWIEFEADGKRFAHTGDQYFFLGAPASDFALRQRQQNHVYRNGALLNGYAQSGEYMRDWKPDIVIQGHAPAMFTDAAFFHHMEEWPQDYDTLQRQAAALGDDEPHFDLDGWGGWIWPYRTHLKEPGVASFRVTVRNPLPEKAILEIQLVVPPAWQAAPVTVAAGPREECTCEMAIAVTTPCRRQAVSAGLTANGQPFGEVCEALITAGHPEF